METACQSWQKEGWVSLGVGPQGGANLLTQAMEILLQDLNARRSGALSVLFITRSKCLALCLSHSKNPINTCWIKEQMRHLGENFPWIWGRKRRELRGNRCLLTQVKWGRLHRATGAFTEKCTCSPSYLFLFSSWPERVHPLLTSSESSLHQLHPLCIPNLPHHWFSAHSSKPCSKHFVFKINQTKPNQTNDTLLIQNPHLESLLFLTKPRFVNINLHSGSLLPHFPLIPHG